jgi:hypothetical protein
VANTILTASQITREALRILHQKLNFIGTINRQYDDAYAKEGAKIGDTLRIRLPNQYVVRNGPVLTTQDTVEQSTSLQIATQRGVDLNFTSVDLTLFLDDFSQRILEPAMAVLASNIESDAMSMYQTVYNASYNAGQPAVFKGLLAGGKQLTDSLCPRDRRTANLCTQDTVDLVDSLKGLFQASDNIAEQYREGMMGRTAGFDFYENTLWPAVTRGAANALYTVGAANQSGANLAIGAGTGAANVGDIFTIAGVFRVHPETKLSTGVLQQFTVTSVTGSPMTSIGISPAIVTATAGPGFPAAQNVSNSPAAAALLTFLGTVGAVDGLSMLYHEDAFTFATADLVMPKGIDFAAREVFDGLSLRIVRMYDIINDKFPCRLDILYGYKAIRPQLACRYINN